MTTEQYRPEDADTPLMAAIIQGDIEAVQALINNGADVNQFDWKTEYFPLGMAIAKNRVDIVQLLLEAGASPNSGDISDTGLDIAVSNNQMEIFQLLLDAGADVNPGIEDNYRVIMLAALLGRLEMVQKLVAAGADVNTWSQGNTALMNAARNGHQDVYNFLYPLVNDEIKREADKYGEKELLNTIQRRQREQNQPVEDFIRAAMYGNLDDVEKAIAQGVDVNAIGSYGCTALMYAAFYGSIPVIQALLDAGADPDILSDNDEGLGEGMSALMLVAETRYTVAKLLIERGADVNLRGAGGKTALMAALNNNAVVRALIEAGADVNAKDDAGNSVLMQAVMAGYHSTVKLLKEAGASEEGLNDIALIDAAESGDIEQVKALIDSGANVNHNDGQALCSAATEGHKEIVELLIQAGADVNLGATTGSTPLANAAYEGYTEIVQLLINAGADIHARCDDGEGNNALEFAEIGLRQWWEHKGHAEIIKILTQLGAKRTEY
ncbi:MAG TPA: ankyrin repeat domain-containing protein [Oculatellaceae cyanobacterium]|jgi:ankyrin repeat protein